MIRWRPLAVAGSVLAIAAGASGLAVWHHHQPPGDVTPPSSVSITAPTVSPPATTSPRPHHDTVATHSITLSHLPTGGKAEPRALSVPAENIAGPISAVGTDPRSHLLRVPNTTTRIVWWAYGARPGDPHGDVVLAAHVDYNGRLGLFFNLDRVPIGALIHVRQRSGAAVTYRVDGRQHVSKSALNGLGLFTRKGEPRLTLITCGGAFDAATHHYADNIVVTAKPVA